MVEEGQDKSCIIKRDGNDVDIYIFDDIGDPIEYVDAIHLLRNHDVTKNINVWINTMGGDLYSTISLVNAIRQREMVTTIIDGAAYSAGSFIALASGRVGVQPHSSMLCHIMTTGEMGKASDMKGSLDYDINHYGCFASDIYRGFLSESEIKRMMSGEEFYFNDQEILERLNKRNNGRKKK